MSDGHSSGPPPNYPSGPEANTDSVQGNTGVSGLAIATLLVGVFLPLIGLFIAVPLGVMSLVTIKKGRQTGTVLAMLGLAISLLWWVGLIVVMLDVDDDTAQRDTGGVITQGGRIGFNDIRVGDCVSVPDLGGSADAITLELEGTPCDQAHNGETVGVVPLSGDSYPGSKQVADEAKSACLAQTYDYLRNSPTAGLQSFFVYPTEDIWDSDGGHHVICLVARSDLSETDTGLGT